MFERKGPVISLGGLGVGEKFDLVNELIDTYRLFDELIDQFT